MAASTSSDVRSPITSTISVVGGAPATFDAAGFGALTYVKIGMVSDITLPESSATVETFNDIESGEIIKVLTFIDGGQLQVSTVDIQGNDGNSTLQDYHDGANKRLPVSIEIVHSNGDTRYYSGKVSTYSPDMSTLNECSYTIEIDGKAVYVSA